MSGYTNHRSRFGAGKSNSRTNHTNVGSRMEWKPKPKIANDGSLDNSSCDSKDNSSLPVECTPGKLSSVGPKSALDIPFQQDSPLPSVEHVASDMENLNLTTNTSQRGENLTTNPSQRGESGLNHLGSVADIGLNHLGSVADSGLNHLGSLAESGVADSGSNYLGSVLTSNSSRRSDNTDSVSLARSYDICPTRSSPVVKLKAPLHVKNKEKRKQVKQFSEGQNIIILRPGMVLMKGYISINDQVSIVKACRDLGIGDGGFYQPGYRDGSTLHLKMMCLGKNWDPQSSKYSDTRMIDNTRPPGIPNRFHDLVKKALQDLSDHIADARKNIPFMFPDICIVNFYTKGGKLGLHQDKDESAESLDRGLPVVSFSIGDSAEFLYGDTRDMDKANKVVLESGDVLIFGGKSRHIFHGVASILPDTAPTSLLEATDLQPGRLNLTFRQF